MYTLILNPTSGRGAALACLPTIENLLRERGIEYKLMRADSAMDATRIAREATQQGSSGIIAIGGDGTLFQIINGMVGSDVPLLFVASGTGNDFVRSLGLPKDPLEALKQQLDAPLSRIDVGKMNDICFLNVSGTGFDVDVLRYAEECKQKYSGLRAYLYALKKAFKHYRPMSAMVSIDDGPEERVSFAILSIGNGRYFGGGMKAVPLADVRDGLFDVVTVKPVPKILVLPLLALYITGKHVAIKLASLRRCKRITLRCEGMTINLDGELRNADTARYELLGSALAVRIPLKSK